MDQIINDLEAAPNTGNPFHDDVRSALVAIGRSLRLWSDKLEAESAGQTAREKDLDAYRERLEKASARMEVKLADLGKREAAVANAKEEVAKERNVNLKYHQLLQDTATVTRPVVGKNKSGGAPAVAGLIPTRAAPAPPRGTRAHGGAAGGPGDDNAMATFKKIEDNTKLAIKQLREGVKEMEKQKER